MIDLRRFAIAAAVLLAALPAGAQSPAPTHPPGVTTYQIDPVHSELTFRVRHLLGRVPGTFRDWGGTVVIDAANPANSKVNVEIKTASIETLKTERDTHLRTPDFFAVERFPTMTFRSTSVSVQGKAIRLVGDLTIRDKTKSVVLDGTYEGRFKAPGARCAPRSSPPQRSTVRISECPSTDRSSRSARSETMSRSKSRSRPCSSRAAWCRT